MLQKGLIKMYEKGKYLRIKNTYKARSYGNEKTGSKTVHI